jgi:hypothetical protein
MSLDLVTDVKLILAEVEDISHKRIEFIEKEYLPTYAGVKIARKNMPAHLIYYKREHGPIINHLIAHECGHIIRIYQAPEEKRVIPSTDDKIKLNALQEIEEDIAKISKKIPFEKLSRIVNVWYDGLVRQLTNYPPDIMIEKWLYDKYPGLRPYQLESIQKQHKDALVGLSDEVRELTPRKIYDASNVMNYAFFRILGLYLGVNFSKPFYDSGFVDKGKVLAKLTEENYHNDFDGDVEMVNKWTAFFELGEWYAWAAFENVPQDYLEKY